MQCRRELEQSGENCFEIAAAMSSQTSHKYFSLSACFAPGSSSSNNHRMDKLAGWLPIQPCYQRVSLPPSLSPSRWSVGRTGSPKNQSPLPLKCCCLVARAKEKIQKRSRVKILRIGSSLIDPFALRIVIGVLLPAPLVVPEGEQTYVNYT